VALKYVVHLSSNFTWAEKSEIWPRFRPQLPVSRCGLERSP